MHNLRQFLDILQRGGELVRVETPVSSDLEIAEIHRRVIAAAGPALLFGNVEGADFPCATNLFGIMKTSAKGPITQHVQTPPDLSRLPFLKTWPEDGGHFITLPLVYTQHPDTGHHNLGMYRIQRHDAQTLGVHWQIQKGGGFHYHIAEQRDEPFPLVIFVGGPPALMLSAIAPLPEDLPELILASLLQGERLKRVTNPHGGLPLIAEAEFAIQGIVPPHVRQPEGPFGDHYGYYSLQHDYPILQASHLYHRKDAVFPATVVGKPPQEDMFLGTYIQELMAPLSKLVMPAIKAMWSYGETGYHSLSTIVVEERYPREAMKFAFRILGEDGGQLNLTKFLVVIDRPMDLGDFRQVLAYSLARAQLQTDLFIIANLAMDTLDYTGPEINKGSKGILIGVGEPVRDLPHEFRGDLPYGANAAAVYCAGALAVQGPTYDDDPDYAQHLAGHRAVTDWPLVFLIDDADVAHKNISFLWSTFTRFEPAADTYAADTELRRHHPCYTPPVVLDCRMKPGYPDELIIDESTAKKVTNRWSEYFPAGNVEGEEDRMGYKGFSLLD